MNFEIYSQKIKKPSFLAEQKIEPRKKTGAEKEEKKYSKRDFLKIAGAGIIVSTGGYKVLEKLFNNSTDQKTDKRLDTEGAFQEIIEYEEEIISREQKEKEYKTISEIFKLGFDQRIEINMRNSLATKEFWKKQHSENPKYVNSLKIAWEKIEKYEEELKTIFKEEGVPEEFVYLSIPESYWNCEKNPGKKAKGVFQITKDTGRIYGMTINNKVDDREDPIKSGVVASKHLFDSYENANVKNWDIALAAYNGSMANSYLEKTSINQDAYKNFLEYTKDEQTEENFFNYTVSEEDNSIWGIAHRFGTSIQKIKQLNGIKSDNKITHRQILKIPIPDQEKIKKSKRSYEGFLEYMQNQARAEKAKILSKKYSNYCVKKGETVYGISKKFKIDQKELIEENDIKNNAINLGQILKIPINEKMISEKYNDAMKKYIENLNYPPKFNAIMELIGEGFVKRKTDIRIAKNK